MGRPTKDATALKSTDSAGSKQMLLKVDASTHEWIKTIADKTDMTQPHVVNLVLAGVMKHDPVEYISQIQKEQAKAKLQKLEEDERNIAAERKRLHDFLKN